MIIVVDPLAAASHAADGFATRGSTHAPAGSDSEVCLQGVPPLRSWTFHGGLLMLVRSTTTWP